MTTPDSPPAWHGIAPYRVASPRPSVVANGHGPAVRGDRLDEGMRMLRTLPDLDPAQVSGQPDLDAILSAAGVV